MRGQPHSAAAMEYLKFCFVFSCWLKFADALSSTEAPQAPAPIPKGKNFFSALLFEGRRKRIFLIFIDSPLPIELLSHKSPRCISELSCQVRK